MLHAGAENNFRLDSHQFLRLFNYHAAGLRSLVRTLQQKHQDGDLPEHVLAIMVS